MKNKFTILEYSILCYFLIRANLTGMTSMLVINSAGEASWLSLIVAFVIGIIPLLIFYKIMKSNPDLNLFEIIKKSFGKFGIIINLIIIIMTIVGISISFYNLTNFISSQYLTKTPILFIGFLFMIAMIYVLSKGSNNMARSFTILFAIAAILYLISGLGLISQFDLSNLKPILSRGIPGIFKGAIYFISYNVLPIILIGFIPLNKVENNDLIKRKIFIIYGIVLFMAIDVVLSLTCILGVKITEIYQYPEFHILKKISYFNFIDRLERGLALQWIINIFCFCTIGINFICHGIKSIFKCKINNYLIIGVSLFITLAEYYLIRNNTQINILLKDYLFYFVIGILFVIPCALLLKIKKDTN